MQFGVKYIGFTGRDSLMAKNLIYVYVYYLNANLQ